MGKYYVFFKGYASAYVKVDLDREACPDLSEEEFQEKLVELAEENLPYVCAHCSGWGSKSGFEIDQWELEDEDFVQERT